MEILEPYAARLEAQLRVVDARIDQMEAQARASNAKAEMDEISGLRARRDRLNEQLATARKELKDDWDAVRKRVGANWAEFRRDVTQRHSRFNAWDEARERRFIAHLDEAEAGLRESAAADAEVAADVRVGLKDARRELGEKAAAARQNYEAWREKRSDKKTQEKLDDAELELEEASYQYAAALEGAGQRATRR
jgi:hypothetical protein